MNPNGAFRPYLYYSALVHAGLIVGLAFLAQRASNGKQEVYRIDFIGPTAGIMNREVEAAGGAQAAAPAAEAKTQPLQPKDDFLRRKRSGPLPKPSILKRLKGAAAKEPSEAAPAEAEPKAGGSGGEGDGVGIEADLPNFPYPWYITQVRTELWQRWSQRMPGTGGEAMIQFSILKNGSVVDLRVESSSGDAGFDFTALSAVQDAAGSFPPLPRGFAEPFLKIHVRFQSQ